MADKKVPVITKDEAISKLRMFQSLIASQNWEDKACVVALQMGIRAIQQPEIVHCKDCEYWQANTQFCTRWSAPFATQHTSPNWYCADAERKDGETDG